MTEDAELLRLGPVDAGEMLTLQRAAYVTQAQLHDDLHLPPLRQTYQELADELVDPVVTALGLRLDGRLVAAVRLRQGGTSAEVRRLAVAPDLQGRGLGSRLLLDVERWADPGTRELVLFTGEYSRANLRLYVRLGYRETHRTSAGSYSLVHLAKRLPSV